MSNVFETSARAGCSAIHCRRSIVLPKSGISAKATTWNVAPTTSVPAAAMRPSGVKADGRARFAVGDGERAQGGGHRHDPMPAAGTSTRVRLAVWREGPIDANIPGMPPTVLIVDDH